MKTHRIWFATLIYSVAIVFFAVNAFCQTQSDKLHEIMNRGRLIIAIAGGYPPMSDVIKGAKHSIDLQCLANEFTPAEVWGFEVDVAIELAKRLKVVPCFVTPEWAEIVSGRWGGRWDIALSSVSITSERIKSLYFAQPYISEPAVFYVHQNNTHFKKIADLSGKRIGTCAGCIYEYYLEGTLALPQQQIEFKVNKPDILAYDLEMNAVIDLSLGDGLKTDAVLIDGFLGSKLVTDGMPIKQLGDPVFYTYIAPAIDKKQNINPIPFLEKINELIFQLHKEGILSDLSSKYLKDNSDLISPARQFDIHSLKQYP